MASVTLDSERHSTGRAHRVAVAVLVAMGAGLVVSVAGGSGSTAASGRLGGDYPAFDGAGRIVAAGDGRQLYDPARQAASQEGLYGHEDDGGYLPFAYPPHVALPYSVLSALGYRWSYLVHVVAMALAVVGALVLLRPLLPRRIDPVVATAVTLAALPVFRGVTVGQNVALALLLLAASWRAVRDGKELLGGMALGLATYKPQLAVLVIAVHLFARRWRVLAGVGLAMAVSWLAAAAVAGPGWVEVWWTAAREFAAADLAVDGANAISWVGGLHALAGDAGSWLGGGLAAATVVVVVAAAWSARHRPDPAATMAFAVAASLLVSPHTLFYDATLLVFVAVVLGSELGWPRPARVGACVLALATWTQMAADVVGVSPLLPLVVTAAGCAAWSWAREAAPGGHRSALELDPTPRR